MTEARPREVSSTGGAVQALFVFDTEKRSPGPDACAELIATSAVEEAIGSAILPESTGDTGLRPPATFREHLTPRPFLGIGRSGMLALADLLSRVDADACLPPDDFVSSLSEGRRSAVAPFVLGTGPLSADVARQAHGYLGAEYPEFYLEAVLVQDPGRLSATAAALGLDPHEPITPRPLRLKEPPTLPPSPISAEAESMSAEIASAEANAGTAFILAVCSFACCLPLAIAAAVLASQALRVLDQPHVNSPKRGLAHGALALSILSLAVGGAATLGWLALNLLP